jgi:predicted MPP superfamily phosphohydrolase
MSFFFVLSTIVVWAWFYIWKSTVVSSSLPLRAQKIIKITLSFALCIQLGTPLLLRSGLVSQHVGLFSITLGLLGFLDLLAFYALVKDLIYFTWKISNKSPMDPHRRLFITRSLNLAALSAAGLSAAVGTKTALADPKVVNVDVPIKNLHRDLVGFKIAQISDLHIGSLIHKEKVQRIAEAASRFKADIVTITGDVADGHVEDLAEATNPLSCLRGKYGNFYVSGNHEYYWNVDQWAAQMESLGFTYLYNSHKIIDVKGSKLLIGGVADYSCKRIRPDHLSSPLDSIRGASQVDLKVLCAHQPKSCFEALEAGYDLQLSGHTHNGQFFPNNLFIGFFHPYVKGLNRHRSRLWVYVSAGTGFWGPPQRFGIPAEITCLTLRNT